MFPIPTQMGNPMGKKECGPVQSLLTVPAGVDRIRMVLSYSINVVQYHEMNNTKKLVILFGIKLGYRILVFFLDLDH